MEALRASRGVLRIYHFNLVKVNKTRSFNRDKIIDPCNCRYYNFSMLKISKKIFLFLFLIISTSSWAASKSEKYDELMKSGSTSDIARALKTDGSMHNARLGDEKDTLIMRAIKYERSVQIINLLHKGGVDLSACNKNKQNALIYCCIYAKDDTVIKFVLKRSGNEKKLQKLLNEKDKFGKSALEYAEENENKLALNCITNFGKDGGRNTTPKENAVIVVENQTEPETQSAVPDENSNTEKTPEQTPEHKTATETPFEIKDEPASENTPSSELSAASAPEQEEQKNEIASEETLTPEVNVAEEETAPSVEETEKTAERAAAESEAIQPEDSPGVNKYDKTYLYDYIVTEEDPEPQEETETEALVLIENPDKKDKNGRTALMLACKAGNDWEIKSLLYSHADINLTDKDGWSSLMYAVRYQNNMEIINLLLSNGADVSLKNKFGTTALQLAATYSSNPDILKKLINISNPASEELFKTFILTITSGNSNSLSQITKMRLFLDRGISINRFYDGKTPLMYAAEYSSSTEIIKLLLDNGAVTGIRTAEGKSAFNFAETNKHLEHNDIYWSLNGK